MKNRIFTLFSLFCAVAILGCADDDAQGANTKLKAPATVKCVGRTATTLTFAWNAVEGATAYDGLLADASGSSVQARQVADANRITFSGLEVAAEYKFRVRAVRGDVRTGYSPFSAAVKTLSAGEPEEKNPLLEAPVVVKTEESAAHDVAVTWGEVSRAGGYGYTLSKVVTTDGKEKLEAAQAGQTKAFSVTFKALEPLATYAIKVCALPAGDDLEIDASGYSAEFRFVVGTPNIAIPLPRTAIDPISKQVTISWSTVEHASGYAWELFNHNNLQNSLQHGQTEETQVLFDNLDEQEVYAFRVRALSGNKDYKDSEFCGLLTFVASGVTFQLPAGENDALARAFPGAQGGGMYTTGGRGGRVIHVTNLNDSGAGSLREAIKASGARTIVFDVAGIIALKTRISITSGDLTIAGQTAPGDGICLKNQSMLIDADNVIIRYLRFRLGDEAAAEADAFEGQNHKNIVVDHCSMSWSTDECASLYGNKNATMQWCLIAESLHNSVHKKGSHGYGAIWGGVQASYHHNLLAHHDSRNPRFDGGDVYSGKKFQWNSADRAVDYRNCVCYNFNNYPAYGGEGQRVNFVANYYKWGPASKGGAGVSFKYDSKTDTETEMPNKINARKYFYILSSVKAWEGVDTDFGLPAIYADAENRNFLDTNGGDDVSSVNADNWNGGFPLDPNVTAGSQPERLAAALPFTVEGQSCYVTTHAAADAFEAVVNYAGASKNRDAVDVRIANDVRTGTASCMAASRGSLNGIIDSQSDVGGYPTYAAQAEEMTRAEDSDGDGIPDFYEALFGLNKSNASDGNEKTLDASGRYTNLEMYLYYLVMEPTLAQEQKGVYTKM